LAQRLTPRRAISNPATIAAAPASNHPAAGTPFEGAPPVGGSATAVSSGVGAGVGAVVGAADGVGLGESVGDGEGLGEGVSSTVIATVVEAEPLLLFGFGSLTFSGPVSATVSFAVNVWSDGLLHLTSHTAVSPIDAPFANVPEKSAVPGNAGMEPPLMIVQSGGSVRVVASLKSAVAGPLFVSVHEVVRVMAVPTEYGPALGVSVQPLFWRSALSNDVVLPVVMVSTARRLMSAAALACWPESAKNPRIVSAPIYSAKNVPMGRHFVAALPS
jgi:hypothetical protein